MTLKRHPEVLALFAIVAIYGLGSRRPEPVPFALSMAPNRVEQRTTLLCQRTESLVARVQTRLDQTVARLHRRMETHRPRAFGL